MGPAAPINASRLHKFLPSILERKSLGSIDAALPNLVFDSVLSAASQIFEKKLSGKKGAKCQTKMMLPDTPDWRRRHEWH